MDTRADHFPLFDSLRAIAALAVVCTHTASFGGVVAAGAAVRPFVGQFAVAVPIFLQISGFLLYRPFVAARLRGRPVPSLRLYGARRALRIVPAYWVALTLIALWLGSSYVFTFAGPPPEVFSGEGLLTYYGFGQLYSEQALAGGIPQAWTVDVEVLFYLLLPLLALAAARLAGPARRTRVRRELAFLGALIALSVVYKIVVVEAQDLAAVPVAPLPLLSALPGWLDHFALGMVLAVLSVAAQDAERTPRAVALIDRRPWLPWLVALGALVVASVGIGLTGAPDERMGLAQFLARHGLFAVVAFGLLLPAVFGDPARGWVRRLLANRALLYVGMVSYGLYLWHLAVIVQLVRWDFGAVDLVHPYVQWLVAVLGLSVALGALSYHLIERPALDLLRARRGRRAVAADQPGAASVPATPPVVR